MTSAEGTSCTAAGYHDIMDKDLCRMAVHHVKATCFNWDYSSFNGMMNTWNDTASPKGSPLAPHGSPFHDALS